MRLTFISGVIVVSLCFTSLLLSRPENVAMGAQEETLSSEILNIKDWAQYADDELAISYPQDWVQKEGKGPVRVLLRPPGEEGRGVGVWIVPEDFSGSLNDYVELAKSSLAAQEQEYRVLGESDRTLIFVNAQGQTTSIPAHLISDQFFNGEQRVRQNQLLMVEQGRAYVVVAVAPEDTWAQWEATFEKIFDSFFLYGKHAMGTVEETALQDTPTSFIAPEEAARRATEYANLGLDYQPGQVQLVYGSQNTPWYLVDFLKPDRATQKWFWKKRVVIDPYHGTILAEERILKELGAGEGEIPTGVDPVTKELLPLDKDLQTVPEETASQDTTSSFSTPFSYVSIQGVDLIQPEGFRKADNFPGFQQDDTNSSVMITVMPGPYAESSAAFVGEGFKTAGMVLLDKTELMVGPDNGMLVKAKQVAHSTQFLKWMLIFGNNEKTATIVATCPEMYESELSELLKNTVLSARWSEKAPDPYADLNFVIGNPSSLKLASRISNMLMFTKDGAVQQGSPEDPIFIVGSSVSEMRIQDIKTFAIIRLQQYPTIKDVNIRSSNEISLDGLKGCEIVADAKHSDSETPLTVYQALVFDADRSIYFLMLGMVGSSQESKHIEEFKRLTSTFKRSSP